MDYMQQFRNLRKERKIRQQEVADYLGVVRATYTMYENGKRCIDVQTFVKLCHFFCVTPNAILGFDEHDTKLQKISAGNGEKR